MPEAPSAGMGIAQVATAFADARRVRVLMVPTTGAAVCALVPCSVPLTALGQNGLAWLHP
jgi:hypothetical protein